MRTIDLATGKVFSTIEIDSSHSRTMLVPFKLIFSQVVLNEDAASVPVEVQAFRTGHWDHALYGPVDITPEVFGDMLDNFRNNVYGQDIPITYEHGLDRAKGMQAAGWVRGIHVVGDALKYSIEFTKEAMQEIKAGKWRYFSPEYVDEYTNKETQQTFSNVCVGGSLTNAPFFKGMQPLNFSELFTEVDDPKEFAVWSTAYQDSLPDSSFMHIESGGTKDSNGKTTPRSLRHFPYKDASGKVDKIHLEKIVQLAPKSNLPQSVKDDVAARAKKLLGDSNQNYSEGGDFVGREQLLKFAEQLGVTGITETMTEEEISAKCFSALNEQRAELEPLRKLRETHNQQKTFAEQFPDEYKRMQALEIRDRENAARLFSENYSRFWTTIVDTENNNEEKKTATTKGFSELAKDKIKEFHTAVVGGSATVEQFSEILDLVASGKGIVEFGTVGSGVGNNEGDNNDTNDIDRTQTHRQIFADIMKKVGGREENKDKNFSEVFAIAAKEFPKEYEAYRMPLVVGNGG